MDFLKEAMKSQTEHKPNHTTTTTNSDHAGEHKPEHHQTLPQTTPHRQPSTSELMESARVVAEAAKAQMGNTKGEVDKRKVAEAAGDLLSGVEHYAKLEENAGLGKYVGKAETYLHKYGSSDHSSHGGPTVGGVTDEKKQEDGHGHGHGSGSGGAADYFKMAEGFLKK